MKKYNEIENAYMEKAKQQLATAKKVEIISANICVVFAVGGTGLCLRISGLVGAVGAIVLVYFCALAFWMYWQENTDISAAPYKNALNVLSLYCNEIEDNGFDASLYRKTIASYREKINDLLFNPDKYQYLNREFDYLECRIDLLKQAMQENFDNYTGKPETTEMVLKPYKVNMNKDCKYGPDYVWETIELACPVKKAEVQTNE